MSELSQLEKKAGRLIAGRLPAVDLGDDFKEELKSGGIGGVTLFRENCQSLKQTAQLISDIYNASHHNPVVTVDQEGGAVQRFDRAIGSIPSAMVFAACPERELVESVFDKSCRALKLLGINILLAPVLDVLTNPVNPIVSTRSYGSFAGMVERSARRMAEIISDNGLTPVGKHFPGHGATREDSHHTLAVSQVNSDRLWNVDLAPFKNLMNELPAILTGHIWLKCVDQTAVPASLSPNVTTEILQNYLKFEGLVITDDLTMKGLTESSSIAEASVLAIEAGNDLLLICGELELCIEARNEIVKAVESGRITEERLDKAIAKIEKVLPDKPESKSLAPQSKEIFKELEELAVQIEDLSFQTASKTTTILKGEAPLLKESDEDEEVSWIVVAPDHPRYDLNLCQYLEKFSSVKYSDKPIQFEEIRYKLNSSFEENKEIAESLRSKNCIFITFRCLLNEEQMQLGQMIADQCDRKIAICPDTPFDYNGLPDWPAVIATFDPCDRAIKALAQVLVDGEVSIKALPYFARLVEGVSVINRDKVIQ